MAEVYIVTRGEYSDYRIFAVYLDKEMAEATALAHNGGDVTPRYGLYRVETHVVGEVAQKPNWAATVLVRDGVITGQAHAEIEDEAALRYVAFYRSPEGPGLDPHRTPSTTTATITVGADTRERALKAATEQAAQIAANWDLHLAAGEGRTAWNAS